MSKLFTHGLMAGVFASTLSISYYFLYQNLLFLDFSGVLNIGSMIGACVIGCFLMAGAYWILNKLGKPKLKAVVNILFVLLSFASILGPISVSLPLDIDFPELFPGLAIPMHFFPVLAFLSLSPLYKTD